VAFIGRSNVGKSSLLNSLARRKGLARVSSSPGKTQTINFYSFQGKRTREEQVDRHTFYAVDLPGYGFARTSKGNKEQWSAFICQVHGEFALFETGLCTYGYPACAHGQ
jgi:GTP-binding protein